jgi:hypothetical protein
MDKVSVGAIEFDAAPEKARRGNNNLTHIPSFAHLVGNRRRIDTRIGGRRIPEQESSLALPPPLS